MGWNHWVARAALTKGLGSMVAAVALAAALAPSVANAQATGITATKHNLRAGGAQNTFTSGDSNTEICVFCHTPHGADTSAAVPLWNRVIKTPPTYSTYDQLKTSTLDGTVTTVGSVSLACLSCHDGTQAMSTVINAPGSGKYNANGYDMLANIAGSSWNSTTAGTNVTADGKIAGGITLIGTDLKNDHPIGIQYAGGGVTDTKLTGKDADFKAASTDTLNGTRVWWVDTTVAGTNATGRQKTDMILYTRDIGAGAEPFVECASCHDPHVSTNPTFLRIKNDGSAVCLACHTK